MKQRSPRSARNSVYANSPYSTLQFGEKCGQAVTLTCLSSSYLGADIDLIDYAVLMSELSFLAERKVLFPASLSTQRYPGRLG